MGQKKGLLAQSKAFLRANTLALSSPRRVGGSTIHVDTLHSVETFEKYAAAIARAAERLQVSMIRQITPENAHSYLQQRAENGIGQKQLDADRRALSLLLGEVLHRVTATTLRELDSRDYSLDQVREIAKHQAPDHALSTWIAYYAGLRGRELLTLRRLDEGRGRTESRDWHSERFKGRDGVRYLVTGKGGLVREVLLSEKLSRMLESFRLPDARIVKDRHVKNIVQYYDIGGGNRWEGSFSKAAFRVLGWSHGAHGLRHSYAQQRMVELQRLGIPYDEARAIIAGEMGHFRGQITETYMR